MKLSTIVQTAFAAAALAASGRDVPVSLSNVDFTENMTDESITVTYDLANEGNEPACVQLDILTNGVSIGRDKLKTLSGDVSGALTNFVTPGLNKQITWQARKDWKGHVSSQAVACVSAYYTNHLEGVSGVYMVVDLSGGPNAANYPISYTLTPPDPSNDVTCCSNKLWLKRIETNTFAMGSADDEVGHQANETLHDVTLTNTFFIGVFPVTQAQYALVMGSVPPSQSGTAQNKMLCPVNQVSYGMIRGATTNSINWPNTVYDVFSNSFCGVLRSKTGGSLRFDLPTEAEWECACRAGTTTAWNDGSNFEMNSLYVDENLDKLGWYWNKSSAAGMAKPVGKKAPNAWGLYDCHGNVWEWCLDWTDGNGLGTEAATEPVGLSSGSGRVLRGGSWKGDAHFCRSAYRHSDSPNTKGDGVGFRITLIIGQ